MYTKIYMDIFKKVCILSKYLKRRAYGFGSFISAAISLWFIFLIITVISIFFIKVEQYWEIFQAFWSDGTWAEWGASSAATLFSVYFIGNRFDVARLEFNLPRRTTTIFALVIAYWFSVVTPGLTLLFLFFFLMFGILLIYLAISESLSLLLSLFSAFRKYSRDFKHIKERIFDIIAAPIGWAVRPFYLQIDQKIVICSVLAIVLFTSSAYLISTSAVEISVILGANTLIMIFVSVILALSVVLSAARLRFGLPFLPIMLLVVFGINLFSDTGREDFIASHDKVVRSDRTGLAMGFKHWLETRPDYKSYRQKRVPYPVYLVAGPGGG